MKNVRTVAANTFREAVRDRVLYNLVFFALLMMGAAILVGQISIGIEESVIVSLGLTAISVIGLFIAVFKHTLEKSDGWILVAVYLILLKLALIVALALLFSCFTTPFLAILFTAGIYVAGVFAGDLRTVQAVDLSPATMNLLKGVSYLLPNFEDFNVMGAVAHGRAVPGALVGQATLYAVVYGAVVLAAASAIFSRRNLK